jgi:hypothetical protein
MCHDDGKPCGAAEFLLEPIPECIERALNKGGGVKCTSACVREIADQPEHSGHFVAADLAVCFVFRMHGAHDAFANGRWNSR